jgi:hypothetical protein
LARLLWPWVFGFRYWFSFLDLFPALSIFLFWALVLWAIPLEVSVLLTGSALEGQVFIIEFLVVRPVAHSKIPCLQKPGLKIHFNTYPSAVVDGLVVCLINEFPYSIPYLLQSFIVLAVNRQVGEPDPYRYLLWKFHHGIEVRGPAIQIQPLGSHKVWSISENEILIFLVYKLEEKKATAQRVAGNFLLKMGLLVPLDPSIGVFC